MTCFVIGLIGGIAGMLALCVFDILLARWQERQKYSQRGATLFKVKRFFRSLWK